MVDVGTQALRDTFDAIHTPTNLYIVLAGNKATLRTLRTRKVNKRNAMGKALSRHLYISVIGPIRHYTFDGSAAKLMRFTFSCNRLG